MFFGDLGGGRLNQRGIAFLELLQRFRDCHRSPSSPSASLAALVIFDLEIGIFFRPSSGMSKASRVHS